MMQLTPRQVRAYHGQIDRIHAAAALETFDAVRTAMHADGSAAGDFRRDLVRRALGKAEQLVTISSNDELALLGIR